MTRARIAVFVGTRPEAIKMAPVIKALEKAEGLEPVVVSTGQHREMLRQVVDLFELPIHHTLDVMQPDQTLAGLSSRLLAAIDGSLEAIRPEMALVQGDTTTVLMAALACYYRRIPIGHVEAGLRTGDIHSPFPEEANRKLASPLVTLHFAPTQGAADNLLREGIPPSTIHVTGNTVIDALFMEVERQRRPEVRDAISGRLDALLGADRRDRPHAYAEFVALMHASRLILTDSGGVQEEAPSLGKPVLVMRDTTERPEAVAAGTVELVGARADRIVERVTALLGDADLYKRMSEAINPYGDGHAAGRIVAAVRRAVIGAGT